MRSDSLVSSRRELEAQPEEALEEGDCECESSIGEQQEPQILLEEEEEEEWIEEDPEEGPEPEFIGRARFRVDPVHGRYGESRSAIGQSAATADSSRENLIH